MKKSALIFAAMLSLLPASSALARSTSAPLASPPVVAASHATDSTVAELPTVPADILIAERGDRHDEGMSRHERIRELEREIRRARRHGNHRRARELERELDDLRSERHHGGDRGDRHER